MRKTLLFFENAGFFYNVIPAKYEKMRDSFSVDLKSVFLKKHKGPGFKSDEIYRYGRR